MTGNNQRSIQRTASEWATAAELIPCPQPGCEAAAEIVARWTWTSTGGPVGHLKTVCVLGHVLTPLAESVARYPEHQPGVAVPPARPSRGE